MAIVNRVIGDLEVTGDVKVGGNTSPVPRTNLVQNDLAIFPIPFTDFRVHDALQTALPGTSATDDLGLYGGTFGTSQPLIRTYDVKAVGATTLYARAQIRLPAEYVAAESVTLKITGGMVTTVAGVTATVDVEAYKVGKDNTLGSDICATAAQSINSLTHAAKSFVITPTLLSPGDVLDVRIAVAVNDAATATAVIAALGGIDLLCDIKG